MVNTPDLQIMLISKDSYFMSVPRDSSATAKAKQDKLYYKVRASSSNITKISVAKKVSV